MAVGKTNKKQQEAPSKVSKKTKPVEEEVEEEEPVTTKTKKATKEQPKKSAKKVESESEEEEEESPVDKEDSEEEEEKQESEEEEEEKEETSSKKRSAEEDAEEEDDSNKRPKVESNTVFLGGVSDAVTDELVKELFAECGQISKIRWLMHKDTGNFKGAGYVDFESNEAAQKALEFNEHPFHGKTLRVDIATPRVNTHNESQFAQPTTTLFIGNIPREATEASILALFNGGQAPTTHRLAMDRDSGDFKGYGWFEYDSIEDAKSVSEFLADKKIQGNQLRVNFAQNKQDSHGKNGSRGGFSSGRGRGGFGGGRGGRGGFGGGRGGRGGFGDRGGRGGRGGFGGRGGRGGRGRGGY